MTFVNLPNELLLTIFEYAAHAHVIGDRQWVVQLALVSNTVYEVVRRSLYHTLVITDRNYKHFRNSKQTERILPFVRSISIFVENSNSAHDLWQYLSRWSPPGNARAYLNVPWNPSAKNILDHLQDVHPTPVCIIASILVRYNLLQEAILSGYTFSMSAVVATHLERIGGYVSNHGEWHTTPESQLSSPRDWGQAVLDSLPALRHILFRVVDIEYFDDYTEEMKEYLLEVAKWCRVYSTIVLA